MNPHTHFTLYIADKAENHPDLAGKAENHPDLDGSAETTLDIAVKTKPVTKCSDKQKTENTLVFISLVYTKLKNRIITDAELQELCADWDLAVFACGMFWASHIIVRLNGWEFRVSRKWFADGANLETASDWISFERLPLKAR